MGQYSALIESEKKNISTSDANCERRIQGEKKVSFFQCFYWVDTHLLGELFSIQKLIAIIAY